MMNVFFTQSYFNVTIVAYTVMIVWLYICKETESRGLWGLGGGICFLSALRGNNCSIIFILE